MYLKMRRISTQARSLRVETKRAVAKIQRANIVETENVIGMAMRDHDRIEPLQSIAQRLLAKI